MELKNELVLRIISAYADENGIADFSKNELIDLAYSKNVIGNLLKALCESGDLINLSKNGYYPRYKVNTLLECPKFLTNKISVNQKLFLLKLYNEHYLELEESKESICEKLGFLRTNFNKKIKDLEEHGIDVNQCLQNDSYAVKLKLDTTNLKQTNFGYMYSRTVIENIQYKCKYCGCTDPSQFSKGSHVTCKACSKKKKEGQGIGYYLYNKVVTGVNHRPKELSVNITPEYLAELYNKQNCLCYYTGLPFTKDDKPSVDRIDSSMGYVEGNIVICKTSINFMKRDYTVEKFKQNIIDLYNNINNF
jgi:biotin operon repressor